MDALGYCGARMREEMVDIFYDGLIAFVAHQQAEGFVRPAHARLILADESASQLVEKLLAPGTGPAGLSPRALSQLGLVA